MGLPPKTEAYLAVLQEIVRQFDQFELTRIPRGENSSADVLTALASTSNPTVKRIIPVEGIEKPRINIPLKDQDPPENKPHQVNATVTRSQALRATQDLEDEELDLSQIERTQINLEEEDDDNYNTFPVEDEDVRPERTRAPILPTLPLEDANHETNSEAHESFRTELEA
ncbi:hypothetical protein Bca4012_065468 [Brassica carinata]